MVTCPLTFDCSEHTKNLHSSPGEKECSGSPCTAEDCCTEIPPNCIGFDCSSHSNDLSRSPGTVSCNSATCTKEECCTVVPRVITESNPRPPSSQNNQLVEDVSKLKINYK